MVEKECILYEVKDKNKKLVRCLACSHKCLVSEGDVGICGVRKNVDSKLMLLVYGKMVAVHVDLIEKKPFSDFLPGSRVYSVGSVGCNFSCDFCQNFDISQVIKSGDDRILGQEMSAEDVVEQALSLRCKSIAYTYNEPVIFIEFVRDVAKLAKSRGLKNVMVSNGYWSRESFDFIKDYVNAVNIDLKGDSEFYIKYCGGRVEVVKDLIKWCCEFGIHVEVTTLVIPGMNDSIEGLEEIAKFLGGIDKGIVWHLSRFFPMYKVLDKGVTPVSILERAKEMGEKYLNKVCIGNV